MRNRELELPKNNSSSDFFRNRSNVDQFIRYRARNATTIEPELIDRLVACSQKKKWGVIDEVQKVPRLLDVVHNMMKSHKILFALTGSSARIREIYSPAR